MSKFTDIEIFEILKKSIAKRFLEENSAQSLDISTWKGQEITIFQEDLLKRTKSTVSEKWFYTYFKSDFKKLPRIDMLNILAQYCGYKSWLQFVDEKENEFLENEAEEVTEIDEKILPTTTLIEIKDNLDKIISQEKTDVNSEIKSPKKIKKFLIILGSILSLIFILLGVYYIFFNTKEYQFCFIDSDRQTPVKNIVEVTVLRDGFTPLYLTTKSGCINFQSKSDSIKMVVSTPFHKLDTFNVNLNQYRSPEKILLVPDDYKIMLYYYSNSAKDLKQRISKLNQMIADNALIYQVYDNDFFGVEILTKQQYINLVSLPTTSLKNYSLIESESKNGKIVKLKFRIQQDEDKN